MMAARIQTLGGTLAYAAMDEPLWFGRHADGPTACHGEIAAVVREIAEGVEEIHRVFPAARIGDIEPIGETTPTPWPQEIEQFATAYRAAVGVPLAFLHADLVWRRDWRMQLSAVAQIAHADGIPFGVIVDSDRPEHSSTDWTQHAQEQLSDVRATLGGLPDHLVVQSWNVHPRRFLPDTEAGTLTNLVTRAAP
jgi:hypothetical protein